MAALVTAKGLCNFYLNLYARVDQVSKQTLNGSHPFTGSVGQEGFRKNRDRDNKELVGGFCYFVKYSSQVGVGGSQLPFMTANQLKSKNRKTKLRQQRQKK